MNPSLPAEKGKSSGLPSGFCQCVLHYKIRIFPALLATGFLAGVALSFVSHLAPGDDGSLCLSRGITGFFGAWEHYYRISSTGKTEVSIYETTYERSEVDGTLIPTIHVNYFVFQLPERVNRQLREATSSGEFTRLKDRYEEYGITQAQIVLIATNGRRIQCYHDIPSPIKDLLAVLDTQEFLHYQKTGKLNNPEKALEFYRWGCDFRGTFTWKEK